MRLSQFTDEVGDPARTSEFESSSGRRMMMRMHVAKAALGALLAAAVTACGGGGSGGGSSSGSAPAIATQPENATRSTGETATFSVVASGAEPLAYQWQKKGQDISGATAASYTTPP